MVVKEPVTPEKVEVSIFITGEPECLIKPVTICS